MGYVPAGQSAIACRSLQNSHTRSIPMKVAVIFDHFGPYHLARLKAANQVCTVLGLEMSGRSAEYPWSCESAPRGFRSVTLDHGSPYSGFKKFGRLSRLRKALAEFGPDCVFVPGWSRRYALAALEWCGRRNIPAVVMSESAQGDDMRWTCKEWLKRCIIRRFSAALVGGRPHSRYITKLGMPTGSVFQGYDVVDNAYFAQNSEIARRRSTEYRQRLNLPFEYFLASARFIPKKNLPRLLHAFAEYRRRAVILARSSASARPWSLVLLGDGPQRPTLQTLAREFGLDGFVLMPGFIQYPELPAYYGLAEAFVHASTSEPWGLVVNEAMTSGLAVLVSNRCGCVEDLVRPGLNGFTFDPLDVNELADLMVQVWRKPDCVRTLGHASTEVIAAWTPQRFAHGLRAAAERAIQSIQPRPSLVQGIVLRLAGVR